MMRLALFLVVLFPARALAQAKDKDEDKVSNDQPDRPLQMPPASTEVKEAIDDFERSMMLSPRDPFNYNAMLGIALAHHNAGRHAEAARWADRAVRAFPPFFLVGMGQAILCYVGADRMDDARRLMTECKRQAPGWRRSTAVPPPWVRSAQLRAEFMEAFVKAGLPD